MPCTTYSNDVDTPAYLSPAGFATILCVFLCFCVCVGVCCRVVGGGVAARAVVCGGVKRARAQLHARIAAARPGSQASLDGGASARFRLAVVVLVTQW